MSRSAARSQTRERSPALQASPPASPPLNTPRRGGRVLGGWTVAVVVLALLAGACATRPSSRLNTSATVTQIKTEIVRRYRPASVTVGCPAKVGATLGTTFRCTATVDHQSLAFDVKITGSSGQLSVTPTEAIVVPPSVAARLESEIGAQTGRAPAVTCPGPAVLVVPAGGTFTCTATFGSEAPRTVAVTVHDVDGNFGFYLAPAKT